MKKFACAAAVLTACLLALPVAGQEKSAVYDRTMSNLDKGGLVLTYRDTGDGMALEKEAIALILSVVSREIGTEQNARTGIKVLGELFRESGIKSIRAIGSSVRRQDSGIYCARGFLCMPEGSTGFMKDIFPANRPVSDFFRLFPREAFLAGGSAFQLGAAYERAMAILKRTLTKEDFAEVEAALAEVKKEGADIPALLATVRGFAFYLENVPGKLPVFPGITGGAVILETSDDSIYRFILTKESPENVRDGAVVIEPDMHVEMIQSGNYLIVSNDLARVKDVLAGKTELLTADPAVKKVIPGEKEALGVLIWTPGLGALMNNAVAAFVPEEHKKDVAGLIRIIGLNEPFCAMSMLKNDGVSNIAQTTLPGLLCSTAAGASGSANISAMSVLAGTVMPALTQARMRAEAMRAAADSDNRKGKDKD